MRKRVWVLEGTNLCAKRCFVFYMGLVPSFPAMKARGLSCDLLQHHAPPRRDVASSGTGCVCCSNLQRRTCRQTSSNSAFHLLGLIRFPKIFQLQNPTRRPVFTANACSSPLATSSSTLLGPAFVCFLKGRNLIWSPPSEPSLTAVLTIALFNNFLLLVPGVSSGCA